MNQMYGFVGEIKHKYDDTVMKMFTKLFQRLPLAAVIHDKVCVTVPCFLRSAFCVALLDG